MKLQKPQNSCVCGHDQQSHYVPDIPLVTGASYCSTCYCTGFKESSQISAEQYFVPEPLIGKPWQRRFIEILNTEGLNAAVSYVDSLLAEREQEAYSRGLKEATLTKEEFHAETPESYAGE